MRCLKQVHSANPTTQNIPHFVIAFANALLCSICSIIEFHLILQRHFSIYLETRSYLIDGRCKEIQSELESRGYYDLTSKELEHGARYAWRNAPRCPGRIQWRNLKLFDHREVETLEEVYQVTTNS